jgi:sulfur-carrier protein adenylyltransferase/sulfurtransferase
LAEEKKAASDRLREHIDGLNADITQLDPADALSMAGNGAIIIDIREREEWAEGSAEGARLITRGMLELEVVERIPDLDQPLILMCAGGDRSQLSARTLKTLGYSQVANLRGGFNAWRAAGLPVMSVDVATDSSRSRYLRHLTMPEVGEEGQARLGRARVVIVGAGGLGSPASLYLAAAGVGHLTLIDADRVERSNLQRQIVHSDHLVGHLKVESAAQRLHELNPDIVVKTVAERLVEANADQLLREADVVIDGSDNFPTRYLLNRVCRKLAKPLIYAAVLRFTGQLAVFDGRDPESACYRCLFPEPPLPEDSPNCAEAGVLGVMPGIMGCLQASETLKLILGLGQPLSGQLLLFDALSGDFRKLRLVPDPACPDCAGQASGFSGRNQSDQD